VRPDMRAPLRGLTEAEVTELESAVAAFLPTPA
jgi:hypothetical protein